MTIPESRPLVSICIPIFNAEITIRKTIESIINQSFSNIEIIVIDNCSSDSTIKILNEYRDSRIRIIKNKSHAPAAELNWNRCFKNVKGEFIGIFHADDVYGSNIIERQLEILNTYEEIGAVFTSGRVIDENDEYIGIFKTPPNKREPRSYNYKALLENILEYENFLLCPSAMIRTEIYLQTAPFRYDQFGSASDLDMWLRVAEIAPIMVLNETLMDYRVSQAHGTYKIHHLRTIEADGFKVLDFHLNKKVIKFDISRGILDKYEMYRFLDILFRIKNFISKRDLEGLKQLIKEISLRKYARIVILNPLFCIRVVYRRIKYW